MALLNLVRPQWKHSAPEKRAEAMRLLEDDRLDVFLPAALKDADADVRLAAARRLHGEANLRLVLDKTTDGPVREVLQKALIKIVAERARSAAPLPDGEARAHAEELRGWEGGEKALEDLALNAASLPMRRAALAGLTHASAFLAVTLKEADAALALDAFGRLTREAHLEAVARGAKTKEARQAAKEKLRGLEAAKKPDEAALNRARLHILVSAVEKAEAASGQPGPAFDWDAARDQVEEAARALEDLLAAGLPVAGTLRAQFDNGVLVFRGRYAAHVAAETARRTRDEEEARVRGAREEICARLEAIFADPKPADESEVEELSRRFRQAGQGGGEPGEGDPLRERFRIARERLVKDKLRKQREQEDAGRREEQAAHAARRLGELAAEAASLNRSGREQGDPAGFAARAESLIREWHEALPHAASAERAALEGPFEAAAAELRGKLETARREAAAVLERVITELESLAASPDLKTAEKRLRELQSKGKALLSFLGDAGTGATLRYHAAADHLRETLDWSRWSNLQRKQALCAQLEALLQAVPPTHGSAPVAPAAEQADDAVTEEAASAAPAPAPTAVPEPDAAEKRLLFARFKELLADWKAVGPVSWDATEATWDRYHTAADALYERFREHFAELDGEREANFKVKEELCARLEALMAAPDLEWRDVNEAFREAHAAWKAVGAVPREKSDALWDRFRAVNKAFQDKRDGNLHENLTAKRALLATVEELKDSTEWKGAAARIKEAQEQWKAIGPVPRDKSESLWNRFHGACEAFFAARRAHFDQLDQERPINLEKKTALCELVEKLDELPGDRERYECILDAQARWKEIGPVPREQEDALWERFRKPLDAYFAAHRERNAAERGLREEAAKVKEELCAEAEALRDSTEWKSTVEKIKALQARWKASPPAPRHLDQALWQRFRAACDAFFERLKANSSLRDQDREGNLRAKEDLCFAVEILSGLPAADADARMARDAWVEAQLAAGHGAPEAPGDWNRATEKVKALQQEWRGIGPVPREDNDAVWNRFQRACDAFFDERRRAFGHPGEDPQHNLEEKLALIADAEELAREPGARHENAVQNLRRRWKRIGPVPRAQSDYVWERFNAACDAAVNTGV
jgi:hypothetical protein